MKSLQLLALSSLLCTGLVLAQTTPATTTKSAAKTAAPKTTAASAPSAADIANAKAKGMVWANNSSKVYHPFSDKEYGTTKNGAFMTEAAATAAGFKMAGGSASKSTAKPATAAAPAMAPKPASMPAPAAASTTPAPAAKTAATPAPAAKTAAPKAAAAPPPDSAAIAAAKASGQVWVNKNTKVYHKSADKEFGTTKNGAFMTEAAATAAGYKLAKN